jgi:hypothetical protein
VPTPHCSYIVTSCILTPPACWEVDMSKEGEGLASVGLRLCLVACLLGLGPVPFSDSLLSPAMDDQDWSRPTFKTSWRTRPCPTPHVCELGWAYTGPHHTALPLFPNRHPSPHPKHGHFLQTAASRPTSILE